MIKAYIFDNGCKERGYMLNEEDLRRLATALYESIASELTVPDVKGAQLTPEHVRVRRIESRNLNGDNRRLEILVLASWFEEREKDLDTVRVPKIRAAIIAALPEGVHGSICVRLAPSGYATF